MSRLRKTYMRFHRKRNMVIIFQVNNFIYNRLPRIGYCGFIPAIRAGNMYGNTYGIITGKCARGEVHTGIFLFFIKINNFYQKERILWLKRNLKAPFNKYFAAISKMIIYHLSHVRRWSM